MIKHLLLTLLLLIFLPITAWANTVTASVDKTEIAPGENIILTINADNTNDDTEAPDLEPLKNLFQIVGMQQASQFTLSNGKKTTTRSWTIALSPKTNTKGIVIPPIKVGQEETQPITIKFIDTPTNLSVNGHDILKIETMLDQSSVYVQQQLILTLRIYGDIENVIQLERLLPPTYSNIDIHPLGADHRYRKEINGSFYDIIEQRYTISPQQSGTLTIPSYALTARVSENNRIKNITVTSNELTLNVKPKPANYPANTPWLPAKKITLTEQWNKIPEPVLQGDTLTRTLTITAEGLSSNQIGNIPSQTITGIRSYPEKPKVTDSWQNLPISEVSEETVMIPTETGDIVIPEIKLPWWNTETNQIEYATVPARTIHVVTNPSVNPNDNGVSTNNTSTPSAPIIKKITDSHLWIWQLLTTFFAITTLITLTLWLYARKQPAIIRQTPPVINPKTLLDDIKNACQENNPQQARVALDNWAKQQPENLTELIARHAPLAEAIEALNKILYSESTTPWQGESLWQAIQTLPPLDTTETNTTNIPPLYPK